MNWKPLKQELTLRVIHREVDILIVSYNRHTNHDSWVYNKVAVFEKHFPDTFNKPKEYYWKVAYSSCAIEYDIWEHSKIDYPKLQKILDSLYESQNISGYKAH